MPKAKLDSTFVLTASCPTDKKKVDFYDFTIPNFILEVRSNGSKTYALRYRDEYGRQRQYKIGNAADISFDKAKREAVKIRSRVTVGENPAEERFVSRRIPTIQELADRYLVYVRTYKRSHAIDERYLRNHVLPKYGKKHLNELQQAEIIDWLDNKVRVNGYAQATVNRWQVILGHMYKMAKKWGLPGADHNPLEGVTQKPCNNQIERFLTPAETQRLQQAVEESANKQLKFIVALLLLTGCRKRELLDAKWSEFDLEKRTWRIPMQRAKTAKTRHVALSKAALDVLANVARFEGCDYVLPNPKTKLPYWSVFECWDKARRKAGLSDCRMHDLRHTYCSALANSGQSLYVIAKAVGHASYRSTERYAHLSNDTLFAAAEAAAEGMGTDWARTEGLQA